ncbi:hypothetical protein Tco_1370305 [Tanacetum coccineum]|uniref:Uncharacterized protein n=1 Tax=Tanacetum coccineum TaxID=301880 RepID=A0ABQ5HQB3_9ASTR
MNSQGLFYTNLQNFVVYEFADELASHEFAMSFRPRIGNDPLDYEFAVSLRPRIGNDPIDSEFAVSFRPRIGRGSSDHEFEKSLKCLNCRIMSMTKEQQQALDDALVPKEQRLTIGSCNYRLSTTFKPKELTFQVALDFIDPLFEEHILTFMRELGYPGNIKLLSDVKVDTLPQPWRTFRTIINKCLSGRVTGIDTLRLSKAQILWGLFIPQHEVVQRYGAILPDYLTNPTMKASEAYKTYHDLPIGKVQPKPKYVHRSSRAKTEQAPKPSTGKRVKTTAKVAKSGKKKQPAPGLETLSDIALTEVGNQTKLNSNPQLTCQRFRCT